jgi:hypothetical protein
VKKDGHVINVKNGIAIIVDVIQNARNVVKMMMIIIL